MMCHPLNFSPYSKLILKQIYPQLFKKEEYNKIIMKMKINPTHVYICMLWVDLNQNRKYLIKGFGQITSTVKQIRT